MMTSIVLAGGKSLRLGREKALERIDGESLIERVINSVAPLSSEIIVVLSERQWGLELTPRAKKVVDVYPSEGALIGAYTGLRSSSSFQNLVVACDMPFLNRALIRYMEELRSPEFDLILPRIGDMAEPLHAIYSKDCLPPMEAMIRKGNLRVTDLFGEVRVRYIEQDEIERFDPEHLSLFNVNTEADLERARILEEQGRR